MAVDIVVPELGESVVEATVARWLKDEGDPVAVGEPVVELETDKVNLEVGAEKGGVLARIAVQAGEDVAVGDVLGQIDEDAAAPTESAEKAPEPEKAEDARVGGEVQTPVPASPETAPTPAAESARTGGDGQAATPVAQRMAAEHNIDLSEVVPTGERDRVTKRDVQRHLDAQKDAAKPPAKEGAAPVSASQPRRGDRREERVRMSRRRRTIARRLVEAQQTAAMLTTFNEIDMSAVMALRARRKEAFQQRHGVKLGIASFFVRAAVGALKAFPRLNAEIDGDEMVLKYYYDIGVAIGDPEGLVVPVLRDVDGMTFAQIEAEIRRFAQQVEEGTLALEDLQGGTFTITNGGVFGSMLSTPILNPPQVGILGLHKIEDRPVAVDGEVVIRPIMYVALSYDHRIVDGREAVQFLVRIKELIEDPETMLLEG